MQFDVLVMMLLALFVFLVLDRIVLDRNRRCASLVATLPGWSAGFILTLTVLRLLVQLFLNRSPRTRFLRFSSRLSGAGGVYYAHGAA